MSGRNLGSIEESVATESAPVRKDVTNMILVIKSIAEILERLVDNKEAKKMLKALSAIDPKDHSIIIGAKILPATIIKKILIKGFSPLENNTADIIKMVHDLKRHIPIWATPMLEAMEFMFNNPPFVDPENYSQKVETFKAKNPISYEFYQAAINLTKLTVSSVDTAVAAKDQHVIKKEGSNMWNLLTHVFSKRVTTKTFAPLDVISTTNLEKERKRFLRRIAITEVQKPPYLIFKPSQDIFKNYPNARQYAKILLDEEMYFEIRKEFGKHELSDHIKTRNYMEIIHNIVLNNIINTPVFETFFVMLEDEILKLKITKSFDLEHAYKIQKWLNEAKKAIKDNPDKTSSENDLLKLENTLNITIKERMVDSLTTTKNQLDGTKFSINKNDALEKYIDNLNELIKTPPKDIDTAINAISTTGLNKDAKDIINNMKFQISALYLINSGDQEKIKEKVKIVLEYGKNELTNILEASKKISFNFRNIAYGMFNYKTKESKDIDKLIADIKSIYADPPLADTKQIVESTVTLLGELSKNPRFDQNQKASFLYMKHIITDFHQKTAEAEAAPARGMSQR